MISVQDTLQQIQEIKEFQEEFEVIPNKTYDFVLSVEDFYHKKHFFSKKQAESINKLIHSCNEYLIRIQNRKHGF